MKGSITADPDIRERQLERHDEYLVLATDGLWDVMTSQEACDIVYHCAPEMGPQASAMVYCANQVSSLLCCFPWFSSFGECL